MSKYSLYNGAFLRSRRRKSQASSVDSLSISGKPLLSGTAHMNTLNFPPSPQTPSASPSKKAISSSPPSLRKRVLGNCIGCRGSQEIPDEDGFDLKRPSYSDKHSVELEQSHNGSSRGINEESIPLASVSGQSSQQDFRANIMPSPVATPPQLCLDKATLNSGLGWKDEFGITIASSKGVPPRPGRQWLSNRTISQSSVQTTWSQASRPPSRQLSAPQSLKPEEVLLRRTSPLPMPSPQTVLENRMKRLSRESLLTDASSFFTPERDDPPDARPKETFTVRFLEHFDDAHPPRLDLEQNDSDDWAAGVLRAVATEHAV